MSAIESARRAGRTAAFVGITSSMLAVYEAHERLTPRAERAALWAGYRSRYLQRVLDLFGVDLTIVPAPPEPARGARLVVSNHRSALDIAILVRHFGGNILSRADLGRWPLIGYVAKRAGTVFVDRSEGAKRASAALAVRRRLGEGATVTVFPEGTTFTGDEVRPFHAGIFAAIRGLDVEVVPVGLAYDEGAEYREPTFVAHLGKTAARAKTRVVMCVGEGRKFEGETRPFAEAVRRDVQSLVGRARESYRAQV